MNKTFETIVRILSKSVLWINLFVAIGVVLFLPAEFYYRHIRQSWENAQWEQTYRHPVPYVGFSKESNPPAPLDYKNLLSDAHVRPEDVLIFMIGGSTVESGRPPLPQVLENDLVGRGVKNVKVINCGVTAQNSGQELAHLIYYLVDLKPDVVIMYDGANDFMNPMLADPRPNYPFNFVLYEKNVLLSNVEGYPTLSLVGYGSRILRDAFKNYFENKFGGLAEMRKAIGYGTPEWRQRIADYYIENISKADHIAQAYGFRYYAFFQPTPMFKKTPSKREIEYVELYGEHARDVRRRIRERYQSQGGIHPQTFFDISDLFMESQEPVFGDYVHVYDKFNQIVAHSIGDHIIGDVGRMAALKQKH